jgi:hypothetical protein
MLQANTNQLLLNIQNTKPHCLSIFISDVDLTFVFRRARYLTPSDPGPTLISSSQQGKILFCDIKKSGETIVKNTRRFIVKGTLSQEKQPYLTSSFGLTAVPVPPIPKISDRLFKIVCWYKFLGLRSKKSVHYALCRRWIGIRFAMEKRRTISIFALRLATQERLAQHNRGMKNYEKLISWLPNGPIPVPFNL